MATSSNRQRNVFFGATRFDVEADGSGYTSNDWQCRSKCCKSTKGAYSHSSNNIFSPEFLVEHRKSEKDFTRDRSLTFPRLISFFMLNMVNGSIQSELSRFFQVLDNSSVALTNVTTAAFCKARKKLSFTAFKDLNAGFINLKVYSCGEDLGC